MYVRHSTISNSNPDIIEKNSTKNIQENPENCGILMERARNLNFEIIYINYCWFNHRFNGKLTSLIINKQCQIKSRNS